MTTPERPKLTPMQGLVLARLAQGQTDNQIAAALGLTPRTVRGHVASIYQALHLGDAGNQRVAAAIWYFRQQRRD
jgi:DNA-binding NarL/FixJ family response regulator